MQYMHIYYQQPFVSKQDMRHNVEVSPKSTTSSSPTTHLDSLKIEEFKCASRKPSSEGSEYSDFAEIKSVDWNNSET